MVGPDQRRHAPYHKSNKRQPIGKQEANHLERPCRRLFVRNIHFGTTELDIRALFEPFGEVKNFCDLIKTRGLCFLTFFDLRGAEDAKKALTGHQINGRGINIHFSLPKEDASHTGKCDREKDQGTLLVTLRDSQERLNSVALRTHFEKFGQIMNVRDTRDPLRKYVEYWDSRDCVAAFDAITEDDKYLDGRLNVEFAWDQFDRLSERSPEPAMNLHHHRHYDENAFPMPPQNSHQMNMLLQQRMHSLNNSYPWMPPNYNQGSSSSWPSNPPMNLISSLQQPSGSMGQSSVGNMPYSARDSPVGGMLGSVSSSYPYQSQYMAPGNQVPMNPRMNMPMNPLMNMPMNPQMNQAHNLTYPVNSQMNNHPIQDYERNHQTSMTPSNSQNVSQANQGADINQILSTMTRQQIDQLVNLLSTQARQ